MGGPDVITRVLRRRKQMSQSLREAGQRSVRRKDARLLGWKVEKGCYEVNKGVILQKLEKARNRILLWNL